MTCPESFDFLVRFILGVTVHLLDTTLDFFEVALACGEIVFGEETPLLLDLAFEFSPIAFDGIAVHGERLKQRACRAT